MDLMEFFKTKRDSEACAYKGFCYRVDSAGSQVKRWRCMKTGCTGKLWTLPDNTEPKERGNHDHPPNPEEALIKKTVSSLKSRAKTELIPLPVLYREATASISSPAALANFPPFRSMDTVLYRARQSTFPFSSPPDNLAEVQVPEHLQKTVSGEDFLLFQSVGNTTVIFATINNLVQLSACGHWFMDGRFNETPQLYQQILTIHCVINESVLPMMYILLTEKTPESYQNVFRKLKDICNEHQVPLTPPRIITVDFESGLIPAIRTEFPCTHISGSYFHFCQAIYRKMESLGLSNVYVNDENVRLHCRLLLALAFVPLEEVHRVYDHIKQMSPMELQPLFLYFELQWMNVVHPSIWNVYANYQRMTNNNVEKWHNKFNKLIGKYRQNIFQFIQKLILEQGATEVALARIREGQFVKRENRKYRVIHQKISDLRKQFDERRIHVFDYIRGISYNLADPVCLC